MYVYIKALFYALCVCVYARARACALTPLCQFTFLNLRPLIFGLALFGWFISIYLISFLYRFLLTPAFSRTQLGRKTRHLCTTFGRIACRNHLISDLGLDKAVILKFTVRGTGRNCWSGFIWFTTKTTGTVPVNNGAP